MAKTIKNEALDRHEELLATFESRASAAGAIVVRAQDAETACAYICRSGASSGLSTWSSSRNR